MVSLVSEKLLAVTASRRNNHDFLLLDGLVLVGSVIDTVAQVLIGAAGGITLFTPCISPAAFGRPGFGTLDNTETKEVVGKNEK